MQARRIGPVRRSPRCQWYGQGRAGLATLTYGHSGGFPEWPWVSRCGMLRGGLLGLLLLLRLPVRLEGRAAPLVLDSLPRLRETLDRLHPLMPAATLLPVHDHRRRFRSHVPPPL